MLSVDTLAALVSRCRGPGHSRLGFCNQPEGDYVCQLSVGSTGHRCTQPDIPSPRGTRVYLDFR